MKKLKNIFLKFFAFCKKIAIKVWIGVVFVLREIWLTFCYLAGQFKKFFNMIFKTLKFGKDKTLHATHTITDVVLSKEERRKFLQAKLKQNKLKLFFELIVLLGMILVVGLYLFIQQIDPNDYKKSIEDSARRELGFNLTIKGSIKWSLFKMYPAMEITNVVIDGIPFDNEFYSVKLGSVKAQISLFSIIEGTNVISKIHLENIALSSMLKSDVKPIVVKNNSGKTNDEVVKIQKVKRDNGAGGVEKVVAKNAQKIKFDIKEVLIRNTVIKFKFGDFQDEFDIRNLTVQHILNDSQIALSSRFVYKNRNIYFSVVTSPLKDWIEKSDEIPLSARLVSLNTVAEANLVLKNIAKSPTYIGKLNIVSENLQDVLKPAFDDFLYVGKINFQSDIIGNKNFMALRDIDLKIANSDVSGNIEFAFRNRLKVDAILKSDLIDLPNIFWPNWRTDLPESEIANANALPEETPIWVLENRLPNAFKDTPLLLDLAEKFDFNLDFKIKKVKAMPQMPVENSDIMIMLNNGMLVIKNISFDYTNGSAMIAGFGNINEEKKLDASLSLTADNINIGEVIDYTGYNDFMKGGRGQGKIYLKSIGANLSELMENVDGEFKLYSMDKIRVKEMANYMTGSDIIFGLVNIFTKSVKQIGTRKKDIKDDDAFIECFVANGNINKGIYQSGLGLAVETDTLNIVVDGKVDLGKELIDMKLVTFPKSGFQISSSVADMVQVSGNMSEPDVKVNINGTASSLVKTGLLSAGVALTGVGVAAIAIGFVGKTVWDNLANEKNPCNKALMLPINKNLSQNVYTTEYTAKKLFNENFSLFDGELKGEKKIFQRTLK